MPTDRETEASQSLAQGPSQTQEARDPRTPPQGAFPEQSHPTGPSHKLPLPSPILFPPQSLVGQAFGENDEVFIAFCGKHLITLQATDLAVHGLGIIHSKI